MVTHFEFIPLFFSSWICSMVCSTHLLGCRDILLAFSR